MSADDKLEVLLSLANTACERWEDYQFHRALGNAGVSHAHNRLEKAMHILTVAVRAEQENARQSRH